MSFGHDGDDIRREARRLARPEIPELPRAHRADRRRRGDDLRRAGGGGDLGRAPARRPRRPPRLDRGADHAPAPRAGRARPRADEGRRRLLPLSPRLTAAERASIVAAEEPIVDLDDPGQLTQTEADLPLLGEHDMDDVCARVLTSGSTGTPKPIGLTYGNFLWSAVGSAFNIGVDPDDRWLCCVPLSHIAGLSIVMRSVIYGTTAVAPRRLRGRPRRAPRWSGPDHRRLAGDDDADPAAGGRRRPLRPAGDPGRRRPGARGAAAEALAQGRHRRPDLRPHRDLLAGDDAGPRRRPPQARLRRPAAAHHPPADPRRRDPRSRARPSPPAAPTSAAGCTPATSATSTRRASSTSKTGSTT